MHRRGCAWTDPLGLTAMDSPSRAATRSARCSRPGGWAGPVLPTARRVPAPARA